MTSYSDCYLATLHSYGQATDQVFGVFFRGDYVSLFPNISSVKGFPLLEDMGESLANLKLNSISPSSVNI